MGHSSRGVRGSLEQGAAPSAPLCEPGQTGSPAWCPRAVGAAAGHLPAPARTKFSSNKSHQQVGTVQALRLWAGSSSPPRKLEFSCSSRPVLLLPLQDLDRIPLQRRDETLSLRSRMLLLNQFLWPSLELFVFSACPLPFRAASILGVPSQHPGAGSWEQKPPCSQGLDGALGEIPRKAGAVCCGEGACSIPSHMNGVEKP